MTQTRETSPAKPSTAAAVLSSLVSLVFVLAIMGVSLFWPAGTLSWFNGWLFCIAFLTLTLGSIVWIMRTNPELFVVRQKFQKGTKTWDAIVATLTILVFFSIAPVAGFDARFGWTRLPDWAVAIGVAMLVAGYIGVAWAQSVNRHFEPTVRIQTDRDHKVIDTGPYAAIRHPGYAYAILMCAGIALTLGSLAALIPVGLAIPLLAGRTLGEEAELRTGLPGYTDYTKRVRWRWLPLVW